MSKVNVRIHGQQYTISGDKEEREIEAIAKYVDEKMTEVGRSFNSGSQSSLAVLAAVNIAEELFEARKIADSAEEVQAELKKEIERYSNLWEDAKKSYTKIQEKQEQASNSNSDLKAYVQELEQKVSDYESQYFDLQMENIQLKSQLERG